MAALAVASVSRTCFVPIQETALGPCHRGGCQRYQPSAGRLTPQHVCTLNARRAWKRRTLVKDNVVVASRSKDDASPNYELLLMTRQMKCGMTCKERAFFLLDDWSVGLMDSGGASIGRTLAKELGYYFFDRLKCLNSYLPWVAWSLQRGLVLWLNQRTGVF